MPEQRPQRDHYAVLGVQPSASAQEITGAYRRRVRALHPDTGGPAAPEGLADVLTAYDTLRDPRRRAAYDAGRERAAGRPPATGRPVPVRVTRTKSSAADSRRPARSPTVSHEQMLDVLERLLGPVAPRPMRADPFEPSDLTAWMLRWMRWL